MTVARAIDLSCALQLSRSGKISRMSTSSGSAIKGSQLIREILQACQIMHRQKIIDMRQCSLNAARKRLVIRRAQQRIEPDEMITAALQAIHFQRQQICIPAIPAVADDQHDRAASQHPPSPVKVKGLERVA